MIQTSSLRQLKISHLPCFVLILGTLAIGNLVIADTIGVPVKVTSSNQDGATMSIPRWKGYSYPADPNRIWLAVADWGQTANHLVNSTDGGVTWNLPQIYLTSSNALDYHVSLAGDAGGNLYTVFPETNEIQLRRIRFPAQSPTDLDPLVVVHTGSSQPRANVMVEPDNQRLWVFTRESYIPSQNVRYHYSDDGGQNWVRGVADPSNADQVRIGSMPYVGGRPALVVLYLGSPLGFKYYLWDGTQFVANSDAQIFAGTVGFDRAFTHNVINGDYFHLVFGFGDSLFHYWKPYNNGVGTWNKVIVDYSPYTHGNDWEVASTVRGDDLFLFYRKSLPADTTYGQIFYKKWSQAAQVWTPAQQVSTLPENIDNHWPNTVMQVPSASPTIPVFWYSHVAANDEQVYYNEISVAPSGPCCEGIRGNVNQAGIIDISDLSLLVSYLTGAGGYIACPDEGNVNGLGLIDLSDLSLLVMYLSGGGAILPTCP